MWHVKFARRWSPSTRLMGLVINDQRVWRVTWPLEPVFKPPQLRYMPPGRFQYSLVYVQYLFYLLHLFYCCICYNCTNYTCKWSCDVNTREYSRILANILTWVFKGQMPTLALEYDSRKHSILTHNDSTREFFRAMSTRVLPIILHSCPSLVQVFVLVFVYTGLHSSFLPTTSWSPTSLRFKK
jgi:hypothetical protein